jgi:hypothetical protein
LINLISLEGTAGGRVPYVRMVRVGISVAGFAAASVAVVVAPADPLVAVAGVVVGPGIEVKVVVADPVAPGTGDASTKVIGVLVGGANGAAG